MHEHEQPTEEDQPDAVDVANEFNGEPVDTGELTGDQQRRVHAVKAAHAVLREVKGFASSTPPSVDSLLTVADWILNGSDAYDEFAAMREHANEITEQVSAALDAEGIDYELEDHLDREHGIHVRGVKLTNKDDADRAAEIVSKITGQEVQRGFQEAQGESGGGGYL